MDVMAVAARPGSAIAANPPSAVRRVARLADERDKPARTYECAMWLGSDTVDFGV